MQLLDCTLPYQDAAEGQVTWLSSSSALLRLKLSSPPPQPQPTLLSLRLRLPSSCSRYLAGALFAAVFTMPC